MRLSGSDIIVRTLIEQGCDVVFGYPGGQIINVSDYHLRGEVSYFQVEERKGKINFFIVFNIF